MAIYIGVNGQAKKVKSAYIGNSNGQAVPIYKGSILPSGYLAVSHIYSTKLLNTKIIPNQYTKSIVVGAIAGSGSYSNSFSFLNGNGSSTNSDYGIYFYLHNGTYDYKYYPQMECGSNSGSSNSVLIPLSSFNAIPTKKFIATLNKNTNKQSYCKYDGTNYLIVTNSGSNFTGSEIKLIGNKQALLCYCVIYQNILNSATPAGEYYPCVKKSTGTAGLWNPYGNNGNGEFLTDDSVIAGPTIENYDIPNLD